jgi:tetratricopeptide (TPR) repeat protein
MDFPRQAVALYGRFSAGARGRLEREIVRGGGSVSRDLTRRTDLLVIGALASGQIESGALGRRLHEARDRDVPVMGERRLALELQGRIVREISTLPLTTPLAQSGLSREDAAVLAAFDLIAVQDDKCRFGDAQVIRSAGELLARGRSLEDIVRILATARDLAPKGRHRIVLTPSGEAALQWSEGLTTLEGQGVLALEDEQASLEDLFEQAAIAQATGDFVEAARLFDLCARADRADAIALYNLANIRLESGDHDEAVLAYQRALSRDPKFTEARYNLAQALEAAGKTDDAEAELAGVIEADMKHADAIFNLARLRVKTGDLATAKGLYEIYLALGPPDDGAAAARKAILYCAANLPPPRP